jgi:radical SAM protein with 4Fe4S-binding SPASM domain
MVIVSLESMEAELYESIRQGLRHQVIVENLKSVFAIRNELQSPTRLAIRFIVSSRNAHEQNSFKEYWSPYLNTAKGDYFAIDRIHNWGYGDPTKFHGNSPCPHVECTTILSDGDVVFCCLDHEAVFLLGNLRNQALIDIFNGDEARRLRAVHRAGQRHTLEMCKTCDAAEQWHGTPLDAIYDDFVAKDWVRTPGSV